MSFYTHVAEYHSAMAEGLRNGETKASLKKTPRVFKALALAIHEGRKAKMPDDEIAAKLRTNRVTLFGAPGRDAYTVEIPADNEDGETTEVSYPAKPAKPSHLFNAICKALQNAGMELDPPTKAERKKRDKTEFPEDFEV